MNDTELKRARAAIKPGDYVHFHHYQWHGRDGGRPFKGTVVKVFNSHIDVFVPGTGNRCFYSEQPDVLRTLRSTVWKVEKRTPLAVIAEQAE